MFNQVKNIFMDHPSVVGFCIETDMAPHFLADPSIRLRPDVFPFVLEFLSFELVEKVKGTQ
jgi:hypothetical protein